MILEIDDEMVDKIVKTVLKNDYERVCYSIRELLKQLDLKPYQEEDLVNDLEIKKALEVMLRYYLPYDEANKFINLWKTDTEKETMPNTTPTLTLNETITL
jgi:hypothetical protein